MRAFIQAGRRPSSVRSARAAIPGELGPGIDGLTHADPDPRTEPLLGLVGQTDRDDPQPEGTVEGLRFVNDAGRAVLDGQPTLLAVARSLGEEGDLAARGERGPAAREGLEIERDVHAGVLSPVYGKGPGRPAAGP